MTQIKSVRITMTEGTSDKEYRLHLVEENGMYLVNYQNGRKGGTLQSGTKTKTPVSLEEAEKIFDKKLKEQLRKGYSLDEGAKVSSPVGVSSSEVKEQTKIKVKLLGEVESETALSLILKNDDYVLQQKFDGERRSVDKTTKACSGGNKKNEVVPLDQEVIDSLSKVKDVCLDGEIVGNILHVFDITRLNKEDVSVKTYKERLEILNSLNLGVNVQVARTAYTTEEKSELLKEMKETLAEGVVATKLNSKYVSGRNNNSLKYKFYKTATVKVSSLTKGKRSVQMSVELDGEFVDVGAVTIPVNQEIPEVGEYLEVRYLYAYKGGSLFQPTFLFKRNDVDDTDCSIEQLVYKQEMVG